MDLIIPMEPIRTKKIIDDSNWIHEIKWDGIRGLTYYINKELRIYTKKGYVVTNYYPEIHRIIDLISYDEVILDGELVVFNEENRPSFHDILIRHHAKGNNYKYMKDKYPVKYILFDILYKDGKDIRELSLKKRKDILGEGIGSNEIITITDSFEQGKQLYELMREKSFEGIVSKSLISSYVAGKKHNQWFKVKISRKILTVVGGINTKNNYPSSLLVGIYKNNEFIYIGSVAIGLKQKDLTLIKQYETALTIYDSPFRNLKKAKSVLWFKPILTCWVHFSEWTNDGHLRHPKIIGFSRQAPDEADGKEYVE